MPSSLLQGVCNSRQFNSRAPEKRHSDDKDALSRAEAASRLFALAEYPVAPEKEADETPHHKQYKTNTVQHVFSSVPLQVDSSLERARTHTQGHTHKATHTHTHTHTRTRQAAHTSIHTHTRDTQQHNTAGLHERSYQCVRPSATSV